MGVSGREAIGDRSGEEGREEGREEAGVLEEEVEAFFKGVRRDWRSDGGPDAVVDGAGLSLNMGGIPCNHQEDILF